MEEYVNEYEERKKSSSAKEKLRKIGSGISNVASKVATGIKTYQTNAPKRREEYRNQLKEKIATQRLENQYQAEKEKSQRKVRPDSFGGLGLYGQNASHLFRTSMGSNPKVRKMVQHQQPSFSATDIMFGRTTSQPATRPVSKQKRHKKKSSRRKRKR